MGCNMIEGYGLTDTTAIVSFSVLADNSNGHVGGIATSNELRLEDIPEMNYYHTD